MKYPIFIDKDSGSDYGVTVPDLPGCFSAGSTIEEAIENSEEAILTHIEGMILDNEIIPSPSSIDEHKKKTSKKSLVWAMVNIDLAKLSDHTKRVNVTIPEKILTKIDSAASLERETRSGFLVHAALEYISNHAPK